MGRRLGQHFLTRESTLERIARAACPEHEDRVIEIGPGRGALTRHLLERASSVVAIELDSSLAARLKERFPERLEVVEADVLSVDLARWTPATAAGNLPYYITSPIIERTLALGPLVKRAVFLVQREVAERLAARPGTRDYGYLTVATQLRASVEVLFGVPPAAFAPPPKVDSAAVRLIPKSAELPEAGDLLRFVSMCFQQKRKTLRNNLKGRLPADLLACLPESGLRAEQIPVEGFIDLWLRLRADRQ